MIKDCKKIKIKKTSDMKLYMDNYRKNNPENWNKKKICIQCGGKFQNCSKWNHENTIKHKFAIIKIKADKFDKMKNLIDI